MIAKLDFIAGQTRETRTVFLGGNVELAQESAQPKFRIAFGKGKLFLFFAALFFIFFIFFLVVVIVIVAVAGGGAWLDQCSLGRCLRLAGTLLLSLALWGSGRRLGCTLFERQT
jgi:hypothetical protein